MEKDILRLNQLLGSGSCCAQALVALGLELKGEENPQLVQTAAALCLGVRGGLTCGALTGGAMLLQLLDPEQAAGALIPELVEWFSDSYGEQYGSVNCHDILEGDLANKIRCPALVERTYRKCRELLQEYGMDWDELSDLQI